MTIVWTALAVCLITVNAASFNKRQKRQAECDLDSWQVHGDKEYISSRDQRLSFVDALESCGNCGASLVSVHDEEEFQFVRSLNVDNKPFWLGATDRDVEGQWTWVDGSPLDFVGWRNHEPNDFDSDGTEGADCAYVNPHGFWRDHHCAGLKRFVCKRTPVPVQETVATDDQQLIDVDMPETDPETNTSPVGIVEVDPAIDQMPVALPQEELQQPVPPLPPPPPYQVQTDYGD